MPKLCNDEATGSWDGANSAVSQNKLGLPRVALIAEVIASDARFNIWFVVDGKRTLSRDKALEVTEWYEETTIQCLAAINRFNSLGDPGELDSARFKRWKP